MPTDDLYILACIMGTLLIIVSFSYIGHEIFKLIKKFIMGKEIVFDLHVSSKVLTHEDVSSGEFLIFKGVPFKYLKTFKKVITYYHSDGVNNNLHYSIFFLYKK